MDKDFDRWNDIKKRIQKREVRFCFPKEIWWCSMGLNVGSEEDGKNEMFERPVLILKFINRNVVRVVPLTGKVTADRNHVVIYYGDQASSVMLSQLRTISTKRLSRKIGELSEDQFEKIKVALIHTLI